MAKAENRKERKQKKGGSKAAGVGIIAALLLLGEVPQTIVVKISENEVTINGEAVTDKETLKTYINKYNADSRSFVLEDDKSIKEAYDWVTEAFSELEVQLTVKQ